MFHALLNYSASTYEAIILAFIVVGLIQTFALWRRADKIEKLNKAVKDVVRISMEHMLRATMQTQAAIRRAQQAERLAMEISADQDDAADDRAGGDVLHVGGHPLSHLLEMLGGDRRSAQFDPMGGTFNRESTDPEFSTADLKDALAGDTASIERRHGATPGSARVEVLNANGSPVSDSEREMLLDILNRAGTTDDERGDLTTLDEYAHGFEDRRPSGAPNFGIRVEPTDQSPRAG